MISIDDLIAFSISSKAIEKTENSLSKGATLFILN
jgi:hypothetical protein